MIIAPDFFEHWKTKALIELTKRPESPLWVQRLWAHCQTRKAWEFRDLSDLALKSICGVPADITPEVWKKALLDCRFVRESGKKLIVHEWEEHNSSLVARWESGRQPKKKRRGSDGQAEPKPPASDREDREDRIEKRGGNKGELAIYRAYPRQIGRQAALKAIRASLDRITAEARTLGLDPAAWLLARVEEFAACTARWPAADRKFIPHPASWFNAGRYDDDPAEWGRSQKNGGGVAPAAPFDPSQPDAHTGGLPVLAPVGGEEVPS